jgi:hypothetical protein
MAWARRALPRWIARNPLIQVKSQRDDRAGYEHGKAEVKDVEFDWRLPGTFS